MSWLTPMAAIVAAAIAIPALLVLYFLKLRRQEVPVSSTLLWKRAIQDLQVNAPFQRLRKSLLLLLQLLALAAVIVALGRPVLLLDSGPSRRCVLLIDRSASMSAREGDQTRLQLAKEQARQLVNSMRDKSMLSLQDSSDQAMVIAFDRSSRVMCQFTTDKRQLLRAIDDIEPSDNISSLGEAMTVARASAQSPGLEANNRSAVAPAKLELFSDGRIADAKDLSVAAAEMTYHRIGKAADNLALVALQARRSYEKPEEVSIFAAVANYNAAAIDTQVELTIDGAIRSVRAVQVPPLIPATPTTPDMPGKTTVTFTLTQNTGGVVQVRLLRKDALEVDNNAWTILPPPKRLSVLLVSAGNVAIEAALKACRLARMDVKTPAELDALIQANTDLEAQYNIIVLDNCAPARLPRGRYIVFGAVPPDLGVTVTERLADQTIVDWRTRHPVLQYVNLGNLFAKSAVHMVLPREAEVLAQFAKAPAVALIKKPGATFLLVAFDVMESNWPFEPAFVMFCYNATAFLGLELDQDQDTALQVGAPITAAGFKSGAEAVLNGPNLQNRKIHADPSGALRYGNTDRAGVYSLTVPQKPAMRFAVNLMNDNESHIAPLQQVTLGGASIQAQTDAAKRTNVELWPYLALLALVLACVEWAFYNYRARI